MEPQTLTEQPFQGKFSTEIAMASFAMGTLIFATHLLLPQAEEVYVIGLVYVMLAIIVNTLVVLNLLFHFIMLPKQREYIAIKIMIMLSNIPIAAFYTYVTFDLL